MLWFCVSKCCRRSAGLKFLLKSSTMKVDFECRLCCSIKAGNWKFLVKTPASVQTNVWPGTLQVGVLTCSGDPRGQRGCPKNQRQRRLHAAPTWKNPKLFFIRRRLQWSSQQNQDVWASQEELLPAFPSMTLRKLQKCSRRGMWAASCTWGFLWGAQGRKGRR